ncbi:MAG TPA: AraC family ligand binding domain-containing protein, partial [Solirubrobacter sp.]|nr:AraC family ligand binding domain-containing protein [Solirubrobacter sp.]
RWRPVRATLGVRAFGVASFTATAAGDELIEPHTETRDGRGHEELYVVVRGAARFELDGETFAAPAGTLVFVQPDVHRHAVATEPGTEVLAFGGDPVFQPSGSEVIWRVRARLPHDPQGAREIADEALRDAPESPGALYANALATGDRAAARDAIERDARLADEARADRLL